MQPGFSRTLYKIHILAIAINASPIRLCQFKQLQLPPTSCSPQVRLIQDVRTQWNSTLLMLIHAVRMKKIIDECNWTGLELHRNRTFVWLWKYFNTYYTKYSSTCTIPTPTTPTAATPASTPMPKERPRSYTRQRLSRHSSNTETSEAIRYLDLLVVNLEQYEDDPLKWWKLKIAETHSKHINDPSVSREEEIVNVEPDNDIDMDRGRDWEEFQIGAMSLQMDDEGDLEYEASIAGPSQSVDASDDTLDHELRSKVTGKQYRVPERGSNK
ncbi:hypothetical protein BDZ91DRAFT_768491 [Kalaharituber pfeilii]|nr:hypothetical protein BDZ91DRAFT_768491 [Kalaharituber pfeilii]